MERLGGPGGLRPEIRAQRSARDAGRGFDLKGAGGGDGVKSALLPSRAPFVDRAGRYAKLFSQFWPRASRMDCLRYGVRVLIHDANKFGTVSSDCQGDSTADSSGACGHAEGMETKLLFANRLKLALDANGVTTKPPERKRYLAELAGVSERQAGNYLNGEKLPTSEGIIELAGKLNVSHEWLATGRGSMHPPGLTDQQAEFLSRLSEAEKERFFLAYQIILNERDGSPPQSRAA